MSSDADRGRDSGSVPTGDNSELCPFAGTEKLRGAEIAITATQTGDKRILFNLFVTSTHRLKLFSYQQSKILKFIDR